MSNAIKNDLIIIVYRKLLKRCDKTCLVGYFVGMIADAIINTIG